MLELEPNNSVAYFNRGSTYDSLGMHDAAIADFSKALELDPGTSSPVHDPAAAAAGPGMGHSQHGSMGYSLYSPQHPGPDAVAAPWLTGEQQQQLLPAGHNSGGGLPAGRLTGSQHYHT